MPTEEELFAAVDALLEGEPDLPSPAERARLREAAGIPQSRLAQALQTTTQTVKNWENGRSEPRPPRRQAYLRLLEGWAAKYPAEPDAQDEAVLETFTGPTEPLAPTPVVLPVPMTAPKPEPAQRASSRRPVRKAAPAKRPTTDPQFPHGPLAVLDGDGSAYCVGGLVLECPAKTIPQLVDWTLAESGIGAPRLHRHGQDADPLIVLTASAAEKFGLPARLEDRRGLRLSEDHPVVKQISKAKWELTQRGFGPWARIYRKAKGSQRQCVQLAILPWDALDNRFWGDAADLAPADLARVLSVYAQRVITPRGSTAVNGLELMTSLRPPTRAVKDETTGEYKPGHNPGSLGTDPIDPAPPEAPPEHPVAQGWTEGFIDEEAYQWVRDPKLLSDEECLLPWAVGLDLNTAFLAAAARLPVGLSGPEEVHRPVFDKKIPGTWLVDLSHIDLDPRLPSPFTPTGQRPEGPAWYATPTVAYAVELGYDVAPIKAFIRRETGAFLDPWHDRLKDAYVTTLADIGITADLGEPGFLAAMARHQLLKGANPADLDAVRHLAAARVQLTGPDELRAAIRESQPRAMGLLLADPADLHTLASMDNDALARTLARHQMVEMVLKAIKATVKGGVGKLRERPQGRHYKDGERWPALNRPAWRPDIRAAVISKARVNMHRKIANMARATGLYPIGVLSDCVVYPSASPSPLDLLPRGADGTTIPGVFRPGPTPGLVKLEGTQEMSWAVDLLEQGYNPARHIKGDDHDAVLDEGE
ncbi:hypothetical protein GCM10020367_71800 [Streptomyces sannanensis]|uniref:HTH cro/C1-type domain-containing protein n=1 Tax=Streptomyces sannanensis TaxID=285536 RepID=A0ABP6SP61_9ACTN